MESSTCFHSQGYSFWMISSWSQSCKNLKPNFETSFIGVVYPSYVTLFTLTVLWKTHKSMFSLKIMSHPRIISYLWWPWEPSTWKFQITFFVTSSTGKTVYALVVKLVLKSTSCVLQKTSLVLFLSSFCVCLPSIIEDLAPESSKILGELNLALPGFHWLPPTV